MNRQPFIALLLFLAGAAHATSEEDKKFIANADLCLEQRDGDYKTISTTVIDLDKLTGGAGTTEAICVHKMACFITKDNPKGLPGTWICKMVNEKCQTPAECVASLKKDKRTFGTGDSKPGGDEGKAKRSGTVCTEKPPARVFYADFINAKTEAEYKAVCKKDLTCTLKSGASERHELVVCPTLGRKDFDGVAYDVCPGPTECFLNKLDLPLVADYLEAKRKDKIAAISETLPRQSREPGETSSLQPQHNSSSGSRASSD